MSDVNINTDCAENCQTKDQMDQETASVFFTEDEPPATIFGKRRHFFAKPSQRGFKIGDDVPNQFNTGIPLANQKADDFVLRNPALIQTIKSMGEQLQVGQAKWDLQ